MEESQLLNHLYKIEKQTGVDNVTISGIPIWRIVRYSTRLNYLTIHSNYVFGTTTARTVGRRSLKLFSGFWRFVWKKELNVFFPFNRLADNGGLFLDKFTDPIIEESDLGAGNNVILDSPNYRGSFNRLHKEICIQQENRTILCQVLKYVFYGITRVFYKKQISSLFRLVQEPFFLPDAFVKEYYKSISLFFAYYNYYLLWFRILKPRRVFVVLREGYFPVIAVCKKLRIPVAEFQHGITLNKTVSYTGDYDSRIDPDYFITFGEFWKGPQFGMPLERIFCAGWAYSGYLKRKTASLPGKYNNEILVVSSPEISDAILDALKTLSEVSGNYLFHIRLHPCESYNERQNKKLSDLPLAEMVDNKTDSAVVLPKYKYVLGENSSVLYEALSVGCKVGMLNMCGLKPALDLPGIKESFIIINDVSDFKRYLSDDHHFKDRAGCGFYSEFDNARFMEFVDNKM